MEKTIYRHCEGGVGGPDDNDSHWKCAGYGNDGECGCECHSTPPQKTLEEYRAKVKEMLFVIYPEIARDMHLETFDLLFTEPAEQLMKDSFTLGQETEREDTIYDCLRKLDEMEGILWHDNIQEYARRVHRQNTLDEVKVVLKKLLQDNH